MKFENLLFLDRSARITSTKSFCIHSVRSENIDFSLSGTNNNNSAQTNFTTKNSMYNCYRELLFSYLLEHCI